MNGGGQIGGGNLGGNQNNQNDLGLRKADSE